MDSTNRRVRVTAKSRQTGRVQRELGAPTSALRWQHPIYRVTGPQQAQSQELLRTVRMEAGRIGGGGIQDEGAHSWWHLGSDGERKARGESVRESRGCRQMHFAAPVARPRPPVADGRGAAPNPARGQSPLRPPAPFPFSWILRNGPGLSRVRKPRKNRAPLTTPTRSEEFTMTRERGLNKSAPPQRYRSSRWSAPGKRDWLRV